MTEQAVIDRLLERARTGEGGGLVLQGEPGIGKCPRPEKSRGAHVMWPKNQAPPMFVALWR